MLTCVLHQALGGGVVVVLQTVLVANHLAVQFVDEFVNSGVQIGVGAFGKHVAAFDMDIALGTLPSLFLLFLLKRENNFDINHQVKVAGYSIKRGRDVISESRGNFEMVTADRQVHE